MDEPAHPCNKKDETIAGFIPIFRGAAIKAEEEWGKKKPQAGLSLCHPLSSPWSFWAEIQKSKVPQFQLPPEGTALWQENPALLVGKMKFHIYFCRKKPAKIQWETASGTGRDVCAHPTLPVLLKTASGCCGEMGHYKKTVWTAERQLHIQIIQQNRDLPPKSRAGVQTPPHKHKHLLNDVGYC